MRFSSSWPVPIAAWRGPSRMSRRGRTSSSWNARASVSAPALRRSARGRGGHELEFQTSLPAVPRSGASGEVRSEPARA
jgi:hypothetical protein